MMNMMTKEMEEMKKALYKIQKAFEHQLLINEKLDNRIKDLESKLKLTENKQNSIEYDLRKFNQMKNSLRIPNSKKEISTENLNDLVERTKKYELQYYGNSCSPQTQEKIVKIFS